MITKESFAQEPCRRLCSSVYRLWVWFVRAHRHSVSAPGHHQLDHCGDCDEHDGDLPSWSGIIFLMDIILISNVKARRTIPLLPMLCHWLGQDQFGAEGQFQVESLDRVQFKVFLCLKRFHKLRLAGGVEGDRSPNCGAWPMWRCTEDNQAREKTIRISLLVTDSGWFWIIMTGWNRC